jgi:methionyl-tRNA formyltransferase
MDSSTRFVFVGDRFSVLNCMSDHSLNIAGVFHPKKVCQGVPIEDLSLRVEIIESKTSLLAWLRAIPFDVLISASCPYILPISDLKQPGQQFINLHGSLLPNFPGPHPLNAAMLAGEDGGVTCHHMIDEMDAGEIISQVRIENTPDLDLGLLLALTSIAEVDAFNLALARDFAPAPDCKNGTRTDTYFKVTEQNRKIDFRLDADQLTRHIRAFGLHSQGATFMHKGHLFKVFDASVATNPYLCEKVDDYQENEVAFIYDATAVIRKGDRFLKLKTVHTKTGRINVGDVCRNED